jgi:AcrR family transcriptional regulator
MKIRDPTRRPGKGRHASGGRYHHGDLKAALLKAAEAELAEKGVSGFTLRSCARRAGVSHAAPAHHFPDMTSLLTEMAAIGFEKLTASMRHWRARAESSPRAQFAASGRGYIDFALRHPQHFLLMFGGAALDRTNERLMRASEAAFGELLEVVAAITGTRDPLKQREQRIGVVGAWSLVHGFAKLRIETTSFGQLIPTGAVEENADIHELLDRAVALLRAAR